MNIILGILVIAVIVTLVFYAIYRWLCQPYEECTGRSPNPRVVVNVPADFKPMASLPPTQIEGAKAALWYQVFAKSLEADRWHDPDSAIEAANAAVEACFPS